MNQTADSPRSANLAKFLAPTMPPAKVSTEELKLRVKSTIRVQNQAAAVRAEALTELRRRQGTERTETVLQKEGLLSRKKARSEVKTAKELEELPKTREGFQKGEISPDNARILAGANQRGTIVENELLDDARSQSPDKFARTVRKHEQQQAQDDGVSKLEHQRTQRYAKITTDVEDGMTVLYGRFDPITGARIETAVSHMMNQLWHDEHPHNRTTAGQRMADALEQLLTRQGLDKHGRPQDVKLLLIASYDTVGQQLKDASLANGTPLPAKALRHLACDAQILPAIFEGASIPLDLGRARRIASSAQRAALIARDKHCVGCGAKASWCQAHHIVHWQDGGPTDIENMTLLCSRCHRKVHDQHWTVHKTPAGRYSLRPPPTQWGRPPRQPNRYHRRRTHRRAVEQRK
ncbi:MAG: DUF222 domain-containing protein [Actinomycetia bacterium]|nr:DUF222 domain-containing protein [Actinomycetes bacterium]